MLRSAVFAALLLVGSAAQAQIPAFEQVRARSVPSDAFLLDRNGMPLADIRFDSRVRRLEWVQLEHFSPALREALIAGEDHRFFEHEGVDWKAVVGAMWHNLWHRTQRGASTLTMQLAGLLDPALAVPNRPGARRDLSQKWDQGLAAQELEAHWTKAQILEAYLNLAPFRGDLQGVHAASAVMFGKSPDALDRAESLLIAAILPSPNVRAERIARRACARAKVSGAAALCPRIASLAVRLDTPRNRPRFALAPHLARKLLHAGGDKVSTSLEVEIQRIALDGLRKGMAGAPGRISGAGILVLDGSDGSVRAWVGGANAESPDALGLKPAFGSVALPFAATLALERRSATAASLIPVSAESGVSWLSLRRAVQDANPDAVSATGELAGEGLNEHLRALGFELPHEAGRDIEASLPHLAQALRSLVSGGQFVNAHWTIESPQQRRIWRSEAAFITSDVLADPGSRSGLFADALPAGAGWHALWSLSSRDASTVALLAASPRSVIAVLVAGNEAAGRLAGRVLREVIKDLPQTAATPRLPRSLVRSLVSFEPPVEPPRRELFIRGTESTQSFADVPAGPGGIPTILHPRADEGVLALGEGESLVLEASTAGDGVRWFADGVLLGEGIRLDWAPAPGPHRLELRGPHDQVWDVRTFQRVAPAPQANR